jgi:hypothetical protein
VTLAWQAASGQEVRIDRVTADIAFLSSPEFNGRAATEPGGDLAARFVAAEFRKAGLKPFDGKGYLQEFALTRATLDEAASSVTLVREGVRDVLQPATGFDGGFKVDVQVSGGLVFVGYGITAPEYGYDDYAGVDARGKVVLLFSREPQEDDPKSVFRGAALSLYAAQRAKVLNAQAHGAAAVLVLPAVRFKAPPRNPSAARGWAATLYDDALRIPMLTLTSGVAARVLPNHRELQERIDQTGRPASAEIAGKVDIKLVQKERRAGKTYNVIGVVEGTDARLKSEAVIVSGHYDHLPNRGEYIYPGANDNGSGAAAVIEMARLAREQKVKPKRTLVFIAFGAEENGLLGAYQYAERPAVPLKDTRAVLNLDMIARDEAHIPATEGRLEIPADTSALLNLSGGAWSPDLAASVRRAAGRFGLRIDPKYDQDASQGVLWRSDHFPFLLRGVPAVWIFAGFHPGYHESTESIEKLNLDKLEKTIRFTWQLALELADASKPPAFQAK